MINWESKKQHIDLALRGSPYYSYEEDRVRFFKKGNNIDLVPVEEAEVQALLDNYDPLPEEKVKAKARLIKDFEESTRALEDEYPEVEKRTFTKQESEARNYLEDKQSATPTLSPIASARGLTIDDLVARVVAKADAYTSSVAALIGLRQAKEDLIDAATTYEECRQVSLHG